MQRAHLPFYPDNRVAGRQRSSKWMGKARTIRAALASREKVRRRSKTAPGGFRQGVGRTRGPLIVVVGLGQTKQLVGCRDGRVSKARASETVLSATPLFYSGRKRVAETGNLHWHYW